MNMGRTFIIILIAVSIFIGVNSLFYFQIYKQQLNFQTQLLNQQISICGATIEQIGMDFESEVNYILFSNNISLLFSDSEGKERNLKNIELFYTKYEDLIGSINIYNDNNQVYRLFKDKVNNYVNDFYESQRQVTLEKRDVLKEQDGQYQLIVPVFHDNQVYSNIVISVDYDKYINTVFDQYRLKNTLWQWYITDEGILSSTHPANVVIHQRDIEKITNDILEGNTGSMVHVIKISGEPVDVISVYYPINLIRRDFGIVFSMKSDLFLRLIIQKLLIITIASLVMLILILYIYFRLCKARSKYTSYDKASETYLKQMIDNLPSGLIIIDPDRSIKIINQTAKKLLNVLSDNDKEINNAFGILMDNPGKTDLIYEKYFGPGTALKYHNNNYQIDLYRQNIRASLLDQELHLIVVTDITPFEKNRKQKTATSRERNRMLEQMRQEMSTPLLQIKKQVEEIEKKGGDKHKGDYVRLISRSAGLLSGLMNDTFNFSLAETDRSTSEEISFSLRNELNMSIDELKPAADMKKISIITSISDDMPDRVIGNPFCLRQVFYDLLEISLENTVEGKILLNAETIIHHNEQLKIHFRIENTGISVLSEINGQTIKVHANPDDESYKDTYSEIPLKLDKVRQQLYMINSELIVESPSSISADPNYPGTKFSFIVDLLPGESHKQHLNDNSITEISAIHCLILSKEETAEGDFMSPFHEIGCTVKQRIYSPGNLNAITGYLSEFKKEFQILLLHDRPEENDLELQSALGDCGLANDFLIFVLNTDERINNFMNFKKSGADYYLVHPYNLHYLTEIIRHHFTGLRSENLMIHAGTQIKKDLRILLAANNTIFRKTTQLTFKKLGFEIDSASDGNDTIEKISSKQYDIVFIDLILPDKDGTEVINEIRGLGYNIPIIVLASADSEEKTKINKLTNINGHITKPLKLSEIRRILIQNFPSKH